MIFYGICEGVIVIDFVGRISVVNDEVWCFLCILLDVLGWFFDEVIVLGLFYDMLIGMLVIIDEVVIIDDYCLVINCMLVIFVGWFYGVVVMLWDCIDIEGLMRELDGEWSFIELMCV